MSGHISSSRCLKIEELLEAEVFLKLKLVIMQVVVDNLVKGDWHGFHSSSWERHHVSLMAISLESVLHNLAAWHHVDSELLTLVTGHDIGSESKISSELVPLLMRVH